jgi:hypothetical protein
MYNVTWLAEVTPDRLVKARSEDVSDCGKYLRRRYLEGLASGRERWATYFTSIGMASIARTFRIT